MNTLFHLGLPHPPRINTPSKKHPPFLQPSKRTLKLKARAKGFGTAVTTPDKEEESHGSQGDDDDDEIHPEVYKRMMKRIVFSVGGPMATGVGLLFLMGVLKERGIWDVPQWLPFLTTLVFFGTSALGIAYGTLSASWDPERQGSLLGWEEAQKNWPELWREENKSSM